MDISGINTQNELRVLLVEDDTLLSNMYKVKFENEGYSVDTAGDGEQGLNKALENDYDVIVLDLMMPKISGIDMLQSLVTQKENFTTPVLVLTNLNQKDEQLKAQELGAKDYILKADLTPSQLVERIQRLLGR